MPLYKFFVPASWPCDLLCMHLVTLCNVAKRCDCIRQCEWSSYITFRSLSWQGEGHLRTSMHLWFCWQLQLQAQVPWSLGTLCAMPAVPFPGLASAIVFACSGNDRLHSWVLQLTFTGLQASELIPKLKRGCHKVHRARSLVNPSQMPCAHVQLLLCRAPDTHLCNST